MSQPHNRRQAAQPSWTANSSVQHLQVRARFPKNRSDSESYRSRTASTTEVSPSSGQVLALDDALAATSSRRDPGQDTRWLSPAVQHLSTNKLPAVNSTLPATKAPLVGIIDNGFNPGQHGHIMLSKIRQGNHSATIVIADSVGKNTWAQDLVSFVELAKTTGHTQAVVNLSFDLTQKNPDGTVSTRTKLTAQEREALAYARNNGVLVVTSAGNQGEEMSALEQASGRSDSLIVVGAAEDNRRANYSSVGSGLDFLIAMDSSAAGSTSLAAAETTTMITELWGKRPGLTAHQVVQVLEASTLDIHTTGWDPNTGLGVLQAHSVLQVNPATLPTAPWIHRQVGTEPSDRLADWMGFEGTVATERSNWRMPKFKKPKLSKSQWKNLGHTALDVAGFIPVVGTAADLANAAWYAAEGDYTSAAMSAAAAVPGIGDAAGAAKLGYKGARAAGRAASRTGRGSRGSRGSRARRRGSGGTSRSSRRRSSKGSARGFGRPTSSRGGGSTTRSRRSQSRAGTRSRRQSSRQAPQLTSGRAARRRSTRRTSASGTRQASSRQRAGTSRDRTNRPSDSQAVRTRIAPTGKGAPRRVPSSRRPPRHTQGSRTEQSLPQHSLARDRARTRGHASEVFETGLEMALETGAQEALVAAGVDPQHPLAQIAMVGVGMSGSGRRITRLDASGRFGSANGLGDPGRSDSRLTLSGVGSSNSAGSPITPGTGGGLGGGRPGNAGSGGGLGGLPAGPLGRRNNLHLLHIRTPPRGRRQPDFYVDLTSLSENQIRQVWGRHSVRQLARNMGHGRVLQPPRNRLPAAGRRMAWAAHHIVPGNLNQVLFPGRFIPNPRQRHGHMPSAIAARTRLADLGIRVNDAANGVWLPQVRRGRALRVPGTTIHNHVHTRRYFDEVWNRLQGARTEGQARGALRQIAQELERGLFPY